MAMTDIENTIDRASEQVSSAGLSLKGLLEDPAIATWAREAASERRITPMDALGLLAYALILDHNHHELVETTPL
jgi:hypothetical protein